MSTCLSGICVCVSVRDLRLRVCQGFASVCLSGIYVYVSVRDLRLRVCQGFASACLSGFCGCLEFMFVQLLGLYICVAL